MAQVNIDDEWFVTDPRRGKLIAIVKSPFIADGMAIAAWRMAQPYWKRGRKPIPADKWAIADLDPLIEVGLARRDDVGDVYVCGTRDFADWLVARVEGGSKGGVISGVTRRNVKESKLNEANASKRKQTQANASKPKPTTISKSIPISIATAKAENRDQRCARETAEPCRAPTYLDTDMALGGLWLAHGCVEMPWKARDASWTQERFARAIERVRTATGLSEAEIAQVFDFVRSDEFWRSKVASPAGLLNKSSRNGQRKIDNILVGMRQPATKLQSQAAAAMKWAEESDGNESRLF